MIIDTTLTPSGFTDIGALGDLAAKYSAVDLTPYLQQALEEYEAAAVANAEAERAYDAVVKRTNELETELRALEAQDEDATASDCAALLAGQDLDFSAYASRRSKLAVTLKTLEHAREIAIPDAIAGKMQGSMDLLYTTAIANGWACVHACVSRDKVLTAAADAVGEVAFAGPGGKTFELMLAVQGMFVEYGRAAQNLQEYRHKQTELRRQVKQTARRTL